MIQNTTTNMCCPEVDTRDHVEYQLDFAVKKTKRSVSFCSQESEIVAYVPQAKELSFEELSATYWTADEMHSVRTSAKLTTRDVRKHNKRSVKEIDDAFAQAVQLGESEDDEKIQDILDDPSEHSLQLYAWCARGVGRGLEKYISTSQNAQRIKLAGESRAAVIALSQLKVSEQEIADAYHHKVRFAEIHARIVGDADSRAIMDVTTSAPKVESVNPLPVRPLKRGVISSPKELTRKNSRSRFMVRQLSHDFDISVQF